LTLPATTKQMGREIGDVDRLIHGRYITPGGSVSPRGKSEWHL